MKQKVIIGRNPGADIVVPANYAKVSGYHVTIENHNGTFQLIDSGSRNGTQINSTTINQNQFYTVGPSDQILLGQQYQVNWAEVETAFSEKSPVVLSPEITQDGPEYTYASFWERFFAFFFDNVILLPLTFLAQLVISLRGIRTVFQPSRLESLIPFFVLMLITQPIIVWLYYALFESSSYKATLGKRLMQLVVVDTDFQRISFARASGRHFAKILSVFPLGMGFLMSLAHSEKRAFHDILAGTVIISKKRQNRYSG